MRPAARSIDSPSDVLDRKNAMSASRNSSLLLRSYLRSRSCSISSIKYSTCSYERGNDALIFSKSSVSSCSENCRTLRRKLLRSASSSYILVGISNSFRTAAHAQQHGAGYCSVAPRAPPLTPPPPRSPARSKSPLARRWRGRSLCTSRSSSCRGTVACRCNSASCRWSAARSRACRRGPP